MKAAARQRDVLVIGIGNPDRGDDGFGIRVIETLAKKAIKILHRNAS